MVQSVLKFVSAALFAMFLAACTEQKQTPTRGVATASDGTLIVYDKKGQGATALVFIHCWACNRTFWDKQVAHFSNRFQVVTMDLPGHGLSNVERPSWSVEKLGSDVAAVIRSLKLRKVILVGHSMGGPIALAAAAELDNQVKGVACVDTLHNVETLIDTDQMAPIVQQFDSDFEGTLTSAIGAFFTEESDEAVQSFVLAESRKANHRAAVGLLQDFPNLQLDQLLSDADVPVRCINAVPYNDNAPQTDISINQQYGDYDAVFMDGVGHYLHLEKPDVFNAHLETIIDDFIKESSPS